MDIFATARKLGTANAQKASLPKLALAVASEARRGRLDKDDAQHVYNEYIKHSTHGAARTQNAWKVGASKLRQVIKVANDHRDALRMLNTVATLHRGMLGRELVRPLYETMVLACRHRRRQRYPLSKRQIALLLQK